MRESFLHNWRSSFIGIAQLVNGLIVCVQEFQASHNGFFDGKTMVRFLFINALLQAAKGIVGKDAAHGSDKPQEVVDAKLDRLPPKG